MVVESRLCFMDVGGGARETRGDIGVQCFRDLATTRVLQDWPIRARKEGHTFTHIVITSPVWSSISPVCQGWGHKPSCPGLVFALYTIITIARLSDKSHPLPFKSGRAYCDGLTRAFDLHQSASKVV